jgi:PQQ-dependent dehydrogenase (methanol/ethanol family)
VLVGNSGGEFGVRGWIKGLDAKTGKVAWTAYSTGPDAEVRIGPKFKPFYGQDRGKDLGVSSWPPEQWKVGGGNVWGWISYDPELDLLYHGTGNPGAWNASMRPGDNKWTAGVFAREPATGDARWYYQWSPHDLYDHDGINENVLVDLAIDGKPRRVLLHAERNGYLYVMDRATGEVLSATPFVRITGSKGVDLASGKLIPNEEKHPEMGKVVRDIAPASPGAKDWQPTAFSPRTQLLYIPHQTMSMDYEEVEASYIAGTPYLGVEEKMYADPVDPGDGSRGALTAWDPVLRAAAWRIKEFFPVWSGALVTGGDVVFYGTMDGWFKAVDARNGELLWQFKTGSGIIGQPVTYLGPDGKQYVAVLSGVGGWAGAVVSGGLDTRDPTAAMGFVNAMQDLPKHTTKGGALYVFALP